MVQELIPLEAVRETADRVISLAHAVYGGYGADVVWRARSGHARTRSFEGDSGPNLPSRWIIEQGRPIWIEDFATDPVARAEGLAPATSNVKAFLGVPIHCDGEVLGALVTIAMAPRPKDEAVLRHFEALASMLGDHCARVKLGNELRRALEDTAKSERRLRAAARIAKIRVWELDHVRHQAFSEAQRRDSVDYERAMEKLWAPVHPEERAEAMAAWDRHLAGGPPLHVVHRHLGADGVYRWVESLAEAVRDDAGTVTGAVGAVRDIDLEKRNELELVEARRAAEEESEAKSRFLATVSHEIRTPLNGIYGMAQAMVNEELPAEQRRRIEVICQSSESLLTIINDVLDLSKINAGKVELEDVAFDAVDLARGVHATFAAMSAAKGLTLRLEATEQVAPAYRGDPGRLRQVVSNLVSNAVKFTERGQVTIALDQTPEGLEVRVIDTGVGIPEARQARIFEPYVQADGSTTRQFGGTGLGLSICRELATLMGGRLSLASTPGEGSCFTLSLPLTSLGEPLVGGDAADGEAPEAGDGLGETLRVLAAEDNQVNQLVLKTLLGQLGVEPCFVEDGAQAIEAWRREPWDLILMDAQMPTMDGLEATRRIRAEESRSERPRTPIIALTANALTHQTAEYLACGMDQVVPKPIQVARLVEAMNAALDARAAA
ncbi:MAG: response regulator [Caulobacteraceae bacterium]|nr:response regulator [Caulobacteraceae bacterium]